MSDFKGTNLPILLERGVPPKLALQAIDILDRQNQRLLPCPLEDEDLQIVNSAWQWMAAQQRSDSHKDQPTT